MSKEFSRRQLMQLTGAAAFAAAAHVSLDSSQAAAARVITPLL